MSAVITTKGSQRLIRNMVSQPLMLRLFINDHKPSPSDTVDAFIEPTGAYQALDLDPAKWVMDEDGSLYYPSLTFTFTDNAGRVYGYFVTQKNVVLWSSRMEDSAPFYARMPGDQLRVTPRMRFRKRS